VTKTDQERVDLEHMGAALSLAARNLGQVWPNPAVGCVIVDADGRVVGRGSTQRGGRPHAETEALAMAGARAKGGTAYVTLEPCAHHGQTPPCAEALIAAGIARCVGAIEDPDPRVSGRGFAMLREAGIAVEVGLLADRAREVNAGFLKRVTQGLPLVSVKLATSLDGRIATRSGDSKWITGEPARAFGHLLRAAHDVIAVGSGTILSDDPELTCRLPGLSDRSPPRVIFDRRGRVSGEAKILSMPEPPVWLVTEAAHVALRAKSKNPIEFIEIKTQHGDAEWLQAACHALAERGVTRVLIEGGATLATSFLKAGLVDRLYWFRAPIAIGEDGLAGLGSLAVDRLADGYGFRRLESRLFGNDVLELYAQPA